MIPVGLRGRRLDTLEEAKKWTPPKVRGGLLSQKVREIDWTCRAWHIGAAAGGAWGGILQAQHQRRANATAYDGMNTVESQGKTCLSPAVSSLPTLETQVVLERLAGVLVAGSAQAHTSTGKKSGDVA